RLEIGGREVLVNDGLTPVAEGRIELEAGDHPFTFVFFKNRPWTERRAVTLWVEGPGVQRHALHDVVSTPVFRPPPILVDVAEEPIVFRGFAPYAGGPRAHAVNVGDPENAHYSYDLSTGALLHAWRGPFVDATDMFRNR